MPAHLKIIIYTSNLESQTLYPHKCKIMLDQRREPCQDQKECKTNAMQGIMSPALPHHTYFATLQIPTLMMNRWLYKINPTSERKKKRTVNTSHYDKINIFHVAMIDRFSWSHFMYSTPCTALQVGALQFINRVKQKLKIKKCGP